MEGDEIRVAAVFENGVFRPAEAPELAPGTHVMLSVTTVKTNASIHDKGRDKVIETTLFAPKETNFVVISEDADLREVAVNYWPKECVSASEVRRRSVPKVPVRKQPADDSDLLIIDDIDSVQN